MKTALGIMTLLTAFATREPLHDAIPKEFHGVFAPTPAECRSEDGVETVTVAADGVHYYEGDDYLLIGVAFSGSSTRSGSMVPLFNGRFTSRMETQIPGEVNARMEMETPDLLVRYRLGEDGEPEPKPVNTWVRCPSTGAPPR